MKLSHRSHFETQPNPLSIALAKRRKQGPVLDLTHSNPTTAELPYDDQAITTALATPLGPYHPEPFGKYPARAAVAQMLDVATERVILTSSTSEAYSWLFKVLCDPGDVILSPSPSYPLFEHLAAFEGVELRPYHLAYDGAWHIDYPSVRAAICPRVRAILAVSPNNPTGSYLSVADQAFFAELGLPVICDEVFYDYPLTDHRPPSMITASGPNFTLGGLSKTAGLPHLKTSWIILGPQTDSARDRLELLADTYLSVNAQIQAALPALLAARQITVDAIRGRCHQHLNRLRTILADTSATVLTVEGGWYATIALPNVRDDTAWVLQLLKMGVWVQPGWYYDLAQDSHIVISLLTPPAVFAEGILRLKRALNMGTGGDKRGL